MTSNTSKTSKTSWRDTLFLPQTDFPMKASLPQREPQRLQEWHESKMDDQIRAISKERQKKFLLHDGPPYANGSLHMGHALNKILKDIINRSRFMAGWGIDYRPGWDCHGLPIEWQVEQNLRKKKDDATLQDSLAFRARCRDHARHWMGEQKKEFMRLGIHGDWDNPYSTMTHDAEAAIRRELSHFILNGFLARNIRPVLWSVAEETALAEAEVDYKEHSSHSITVAFAIEDANTDEDADLLKKAIIPVWTTTPWTLPANTALACGSQLTYLLIKLAKSQSQSQNQNHRHVLIAEERLADFTTLMEEESEILRSWTGEQLKGIRTRHPLHAEGFVHEPMLYAADFVSADTGTGFVHIAPAHGEDDFRLARTHDIAITECVDGRGIYTSETPLVAGQFIFKAQELILRAMEQAGTLWHKTKISHDYPHSWRSGKPLIYRNTPQWFISMEHHDLRQTALKAIEGVHWHPAKGKMRITSMVEQRPDWCLSRQRRWGVPLAIFYHKESGKLLQDKDMEERIITSFKEHGADAWFEGDPKRFLPEECSQSDYEVVHDILDVWFDSGSSHAFVLNGEQADLYLEGSDQHRGWFQASLLGCCGTRGRAPYRHVLTHGFVLDNKGHKMSKSQGNVVTPQKVMEHYGADVLRLWVAMSDVSEDLKLGPNTLSFHSDAYRRLRNCLRFLLGALHHHDGASTYHSDGASILPPLASLAPLERWLLHRLSQCDQARNHARENYRLTHFYNELHNFCALDLSAFYLDIRKDTLYCEDKKSILRQQSLAVLNVVFDCLCTWLAPVLVFTCDEAWHYRYGKDERIHLSSVPHLDDFTDDKIEEQWKIIRSARRIITTALERGREQKDIRSSLEAEIILYGDEETLNICRHIDMAELALVASCDYAASTDGNLSATLTPTKHEKCARCWRHQAKITEGLCPRCHKIAHLKNAS